jgi:hypothetical protein
MENHHRREYHHHHRHHHIKTRIRETIIYMLPTMAICIAIAALLVAGRVNILTSTGNIILYGIVVVVFPVIVILLLCRVLANGIFAIFNFLFKLFTGRKF